MNTASIFRAGVSCGLIGLALSGAPASADAPRYKFTDLSAIDRATFPGTNSEAFSINNKGQIVGYMSTVVTGNYHIYDWQTGTWSWKQASYEPPHAFVYDNGQVFDLGQQAEASQAYGINDAGRIVGSVGFANNERRAFRSVYGPLNETGNIKDFVDHSIEGTEAWGINNANQILVRDCYGAAYYYENNQLHKFMDGQVNWFQRAINNNGVIAGEFYPEPGKTGAVHANTYNIRTGQLTDLGILAKNPCVTLDNGYTRWYQCFAWSLNDAGDVVGSSDIDKTPSDVYVRHHAYLSRNGSMLDLGTLAPDEDSEAYAINNQGQVVGNSGRKTFLYTDDAMYDLQSLTEGIPAGWTLERVWDINDSGQIVGYAREEKNYTQYWHAMLLTPIQTGLRAMAMATGSEFEALEGTFSPSYLSEPLNEPVVPEPGAIGLFLMAGVGLLRRRRTA